MVGKQQQKPLAVVFLCVVMTSACVIASAPPLTSDDHRYGIDSDEKKLIHNATAADEEVRRKGLLLQDEKVESYIREVGNKIVPPAVAQFVTFRFYVLRDPVVNAFASPNGSIYLHVGLLARIENEAQLAQVLGHEVAHVVQRHGLQRQRTRRATFIAANVADIALFGTSIAYIPAFGALASYSRENEAEADRLGLRYMAAAGYSLEQADQLFKILAQVKKSESVWGSVYSSHPDNEQRATQAREIINNEMLASAAGRRVGVESYAEVRNRVILEDIRLKLNVKYYELAIESADAALSRNSNSVWLHYYRGEAHRLTAEDPQGAAREHARIHGQKLDQALVLEFRDKKRKLLATAKQSFENALQIEKGFVPAYRGLGLVAYAEGDSKAARAALTYYLSNGENLTDRRYINEIIGRLNNGS